jgi:hypothetical protein
MILRKRSFQFNIFFEAFSFDSIFENSPIIFISIENKKSKLRLIKVFE